MPHRGLHWPPRYVVSLVVWGESCSLLWVLKYVMSFVVCCESCSLFRVLQSVVCRVVCCNSRLQTSCLLNNKKRNHRDMQNTRRTTVKQPNSSRHATFKTPINQDSHKSRLRHQQSPPNNQNTTESIPTRLHLGGKKPKRKSLLISVFDKSISAHTRSGIVI